MVNGRLELTIKINELPSPEPVENGWQQFSIDCEGVVFKVTVRPKIWRRLEEAEKNYPMWVAAVSGKLGAKTDDGYVLEQPSIQAFERKPKEPKAAEPDTKQAAPA